MVWNLVQNSTSKESDRFDWSIVRKSKGALTTQTHITSSQRLDTYRLIVNDGISGDFYLQKSTLEARLLISNGERLSGEEETSISGDGKYKMEVTFSL